jgi:hypothetical protein
MNSPIKPRVLIPVTLMAMIFAAQIFAYPLDGADDSGIRRLYAIIAQQSAPTGPKLVKGSLLNNTDIQLTLAGKSYDKDFDKQPVHPQLQFALESIFKTRDPSYGVVVIDITNPDQPAWAAVRPDIKENVGSVGKIIVMAGLFNALARAFPDIEDRKRVLRETIVTAGDWVNTDSHRVPHYIESENKNQPAVPVPADKFALSEWIDHMISASSNASASVVWRETMLMYHFGAAYPVSQAEADEFFKKTPGPQLLQLAQKVNNEPLQAVGIQAKDMQQGSFWTRVGKSRVPGIQSYGTPRELARYLFQLEQGHLVDDWSSLEMKKYFYMTSRRYRYAYPPELHNSAVYFKSGSLYQCVPEEGFRCAKYAGNKRNMMNSIVIIESLPGAEQYYRYIVAMISNVLKVNSAWDHSRLGAAIHAAVLTRNETTVDEKGDMKHIIESGLGGDG